MNSPCLFLRRLGVDDIDLPERKATMREISTLVAARYGLTLEDMRSRRNRRALSIPRHEAMSLIRAEGRYSFPQIGGYFGGRHHTTIMHGVRAHEDRLAAARGIAAG